MGTRLWLVRHGQTDWNFEGRIQGHTPTELNATGRRQAMELAVAFARKRFAAVYASDLPRAMQTAAPIAAELGLGIISTPLLRERDLGPYEGLLEPQAVALRRSSGAGAGRGDLADWTGVPGVETDAAVWERADRIFREIIAAHEECDVLVVTHGGILARTIYKTLGIPDSQERRFSLANGMVAVVEYRDGWPFLLSLADVGLMGEGRPTADTATARGG